MKLGGFVTQTLHLCFAKLILLQILPNIQSVFFTSIFPKNLKMCLVQVKVIYDYYTSKRVTPFFIAEDELLEYDFQAFKEHIVREVPHLGKVTSLSSAPLRLTMNEGEHEVDISEVYFSFQLKRALLKQKNDLRSSLYISVTISRLGCSCQSSIRV